MAMSALALVAACGGEESSPSPSVAEPDLCEAPLTCAPVRATGALGCLSEDEVPDDAKTGCHEDPSICDDSESCHFTNLPKSASACVENCFQCSATVPCEGGAACRFGLCVPTDCQDVACGEGEICWEDACVPDFGPGPGVADVSCERLPLECDPATDDCGELITFDPRETGGYVDAPVNGETDANQYRSYLRRDAVTAVQYAADRVACLAAGWPFGNGGPIGLADMSEADGAIPGTSVGSPDHPSLTHTDGFDIDIAYFQTGTSDNLARPICEHKLMSVDVEHCTATPHVLDPYRTALLIGSLQEHPQLRVIGCDGRAAGLLGLAMAQLCDDGWLPEASCDKQKLAFEKEDTGFGWFRNHHHHLHVSFEAPSP